MNRLDWMIDTVQYIKNKYGEVDYAKSNNEYWLKNDSKLREWFNVKNGYRFNELETYQSKSKMKEFFNKAGVKTARYILVESLEKSLDFVSKVGYPVFAKPDSGVGASSTFKIHNEEELRNFHNQYLGEQYIMEEFLDGFIVSFDGIANSKSEVTIAFKETFPTPIAEVVTTNSGVFYFAETNMPDEYRKMGERIVKAFNIKSRCFHIELFQLNSDRPGLANKGEIVALEANLRSPGGNTPDLLNLVSKVNYYDAYAQMITEDIANLDNVTNLIAFSINRKNEYNYVLNSWEIMQKYAANLQQNGFYPQSFRNAMGDEYFFFVFDRNDKSIPEFIKLVRAKK